MPSLTRYRYADPRIRSGVTFTESEWLHSAAPHFECLEETEAEFHLWLIQEVWHSHILAGNIIAEVTPDRRRPFKELPDIARCRHEEEFSKHTGKGHYLCLGCGMEYTIRGRSYFCSLCPYDYHTLTWEELKDHETEYHDKPSSLKPHKESK